MDSRSVAEARLNMLAHVQNLEIESLLGGVITSGQRLIWGKRCRAQPTTCCNIHQLSYKTVQRLTLAGKPPIYEAVLCVTCVTNNVTLCALPNVASLLCHKNQCCVPQQSLYALTRWCLTLQQNGPVKHLTPYKMVPYAPATKRCSTHARPNHFLVSRPNIEIRRQYFAQPKYCSGPNIEIRRQYFAQRNPNQNQIHY